MMGNNARLVDHLRDWADDYLPYSAMHKDLVKAADEIERLESELAKERERARLPDELVINARRAIDQRGLEYDAHYFLLRGLIVGILSAVEPKE